MGLFFQSTGEHFRHGAFLQVQVVEHDFELCAILRHIVGFTAKKGVFTFTDVVDFFGYQLRHFSSGTCHEYLFRKEFARVYNLLRGGGYFGCRFRTAAERHVDGTYDAVFGKLH